MILLLFIEALLGSLFRFTGNDLIEALHMLNLHISFESALLAACRLASIVSNHWFTEMKNVPSSLANRQA